MLLDLSWLGVARTGALYITMLHISSSNHFCIQTTATVSQQSLQITSIESIQLNVIHANQKTHATCRRVPTSQDVLIFIILSSFELLLTDPIIF